MLAHWAVSRSWGGAKGRLVPTAGLLEILTVLLTRLQPTPFSVQASWNLPTPNLPSAAATQASLEEEGG